MDSIKYLDVLTKSDVKVALQEMSKTYVYGLKLNHFLSENYAVGQIFQPHCTGAVIRLLEHLFNITNYDIQVSCRNGRKEDAYELIPYFEVYSKDDVYYYEKNVDELVEFLFEEKNNQATLDNLECNFFRVDKDVFTDVLEKVIDVLKYTEALNNFFKKNNVEGYIYQPDSTYEVFYLFEKLFNFKTGNPIYMFCQEKSWQKKEQNVKVTYGGHETEVSTLEELFDFLSKGVSTI